MTEIDRDPVTVPQVQTKMPTSKKEDVFTMRTCIKKRIKFNPLLGKKLSSDKEHSLPSKINWRKLYEPENCVLWGITLSESKPFKPRNPIRYTARK